MVACKLLTCYLLACMRAEMSTNSAGDAERASCHCFSVMCEAVVVPSVVATMRCHSGDAEGKSISASSAENSASEICHAHVSNEEEELGT